MPGLGLVTHGFLCPPYAEEIESRRVTYLAHYDIVLLQEKRA